MLTWLQMAPLPVEPKVVSALEVEEEQREGTAKVGGSQGPVNL
jgi:hypothetical protein